MYNSKTSKLGLFKFSKLEAQFLIVSNMIFQY